MSVFSWKEESCRVVTSSWSTHITGPDERTGLDAHHYVGERLGFMYVAVSRNESSANCRYQT